MFEILNVGLSLDDTSINGTLLMELTEDDEEEDDEELPDDDDDTIGGGFAAFPLWLETAGFDDDPPASFSCVGAFLNNFGEVCGLWAFSPRVNVKLLLKAWMDDSARLKSLS